MSGREHWRRDGADWPNREASRFVRTTGLTWHVQVMGAGPTLLLVHGTGAATHSWRGLMPLLARHFTVVAPDLPGHGFTDPLPFRKLSLPGMSEAVGAVCGRLGFRPEIAVGHTAGAAVAIRMTLDGRIAPAAIVSLNGAVLPIDASTASPASSRRRALWICWRRWRSSRSWRLQLCSRSCALLSSARRSASKPVVASSPTGLFAPSSAAASWKLFAAQNALT